MVSRSVTATAAALKSLNIGPDLRKHLGNCRVLRVDSIVFETCSPTQEFNSRINLILINNPIEMPIVVVTAL